MAKIVCVLYDDPVDGYPKSYPRDDIPKIEAYPDGQTTPSPKGIDFKPGELLGSVSGELGLRRFLENAGHTFVVTSDKDGKDSRLDKELPDAEIVISQPFWPAYMTAERFAKAPKLKLVVTAGIGSDHTDLRTYRHDDSEPCPELYSVLSMGGKGRMEYRRLRRSLLRYRGDADRYGRRRSDRARGLAAPQTVRCQAALYRPPPTSGRSREGARSYVSSERGIDGASLRRGDDQLSVASGNREYV